MKEALAKWVGELREKPLPVLSSNLKSLRQLCISNTDMRQLSDIVDRDPGLSVLLLRHINQIRHQHLRSEITTPHHAMMMVGLEQVRQLLNKASEAEQLPQSAQRRLREQFSQSFHAAYQARDWGRLQRDLGIDELFSAALLGNLGETMLNLYAPDLVDQVHAQMYQEEMEAEEAQYVVFGFSYNQLTLELARAWHLPNLLCDSMQAENASMGRVLNVMLASQLARCCRHGWYSRALSHLIDGIADYLYSDSASTATLVHRNAVEAARASEFYDVPHPAALLLLPAKQFEVEPQAEESSPTKPQPEIIEVEESISEGTEFCLAPQRRVLARVLKQLNRTDRRLPQKEVLRLTLEGMHDGLGLNRTVFAGLTPNREQLRAAFIQGGDDEPAFKRFTIDLDNHNLFARLMEQQHSLWLDDHNRKKFYPLIPINFHKVVDNNSFFAMSLFLRGRPMGLFYADRRNRDCRLDEVGYKRFKQLVLLAGHHLAREQ